MEYQNRIQRLASRLQRLHEEKKDTYERETGKKLTARALAHELGCSPSYLSELLHGAKAHPSDEFIGRAARFFDVTTHYLVGEDIDERFAAIQANTGIDVEQLLDRFGVNGQLLLRLFSNRVEAMQRFVQTFLSLQGRYGFRMEELLEEWNLVRISLDRGYFLRIEEQAGRLAKAWKLEGLTLEELHAQVARGLEAQGIRLLKTGPDDPLWMQHIWASYQPSHRTLTTCAELNLTRQILVMLRTRILREVLQWEGPRAYPPTGERSLAQITREHDAWQLALCLIIARDRSEALLETLVTERSPQQAVEALKGELRLDQGGDAVLHFARLAHSAMLSLGIHPHFLVMERWRRENGLPYYAIVHHFLPTESRIKRFVRYEAHCRRWQSIVSLDDMMRRMQNENSVPVFAIQQSDFTDQGSSTLVYTVAIDSGRGVPRSVTLALPIQPLRARMRMRGHPDLKRVEVGQTCESCTLFDNCHDRVDHIVRHRP